MKKNRLTPEEERIIINKGTEPPFTGEYDDFFIDGYFHCRQCGAKLYSSKDKFNSGCGWPSFDDEASDKVERQLDADGRRTEILCRTCGGHLGHVFEGENLTEKNTRHCVNSLSIKFREASYAYFAGGCFWGVEHLMQKQPGVFSVVSGYMGGDKENPTYEEVCTGKTGHLEVVRVAYDPEEVSYDKLSKLFFEIHDPTQANGQGPDIGSQYLSAVFCSTDEEFDIVNNNIQILRDRGLNVVTEVRDTVKFWPAEGYHQDYYVKHGKEPYCHSYKKRF